MSFLFFRFLSATLFLAGVFFAGIVSKAATSSVKAGQSCVISVTADGSAPFSYQWFRDGKILAGETSATYSIASLVATDAGVYHARVANSAGFTDSDPITLALVFPPVFATQPSGGSVSAGDSVTFSASATGTPAPSYQWRRNGSIIAGATHSSYSLASVSGADAGTYTVVATNSAGSVTSTGAVLAVNAAAVVAVSVAAPVFVVQPISQAVKKTRSVTLVARAEGTPSPTYQWRRNGFAIGGATGATYTISNLSTSKAGTYTVVATNGGGSATSEGAVLTVTNSDAALAAVDFDADGQTDILWQNIATGDLAVWGMNGVNKGSVSSLGEAAAAWRISGGADFNGDGDTDILSHNTTTGEWSIWLMAGSSVAGKVSLGAQPLNSRISGIGDFNGDHRPDIVVQDSETGSVAIWLMAGAVRSKVVSLGNPGKGWLVGASGDFNGDGKSDLVFQNELTGQTYVWLLSGTKVTWKAWVVNQPLEWQIGGTGDFNADGKSDILWQNVLTGECALWLMSANSVKDTVSLGTVSVDWLIRN